MKRKTTIYVTVAIAVAVVALLIIGFGTGVLPGKVFPILKKAMTAIPPKMWTRLLFKILVLTGLMGHVTKTVNARKERFLNGEIEYSLDKNYSLVVGYDFQTRPLIKRLLGESSATAPKPTNKAMAKCAAMLRRLFAFPPDNCVLLITDRDVRKIMADMATELTKEERKRVLYMRRDLASPKSYSSLRIRGAREVYLMGDEGVPGRDGIILQASKVIAEKARAEESSSRPIKVYLQFDDPGFYSQMCSKRLPMDPETKKDEKGKDTGTVDPKTVLFNLEVFNYYDSWVWKCWSEKDSADGGSPYLPLRFKADAERVELFVIGSGRAMKAVVDSAITLMNYGDDTRHCRLSVVSDRNSALLPPDEVLASLPELEVVAYSTHDLNRKVATKMIEATMDEKCAVTVAIVEDSPDKSMKTYLSLPFALRNRGISALLWMETQTRNLSEKSLIQVDDDKTQLRYFGMTDCLPWYGSNRQAAGADVNYYYFIRKELPGYEDPELAEAAMRLWDEHAAFDAWNESPRWGKNSSINSAGSFKEKAAIIAGRALTPELQLLLLKAEHNRWWAERLLANWRYGERNDNRRTHPNLVPFEKLDEDTKDKDKINIAAMARQGYLITAN